MATDLRVLLGLGMKKPRTRQHLDGGLNALLQRLQEWQKALGNISSNRDQETLRGLRLKCRYASAIRSAKRKQRILRHVGKALCKLQLELFTQQQKQILAYQAEEHAKREAAASAQRDLKEQELQDQQRRADCASLLRSLARNVKMGSFRDEDMQDKLADVVMHLTTPSTVASASDGTARAVPSEDSASMQHVSELRACVLRLLRLSRLSQFKVLLLIAAAFLQTRPTLPRPPAAKSASVFTRQHFLPMLVVFKDDNIAQSFASCMKDVASNMGVELQFLQSQTNEASVVVDNNDAGVVVNDFASYLSNLQRRASNAKVVVTGQGSAKDLFMEYSNLCAGLVVQYADEAGCQNWLPCPVVDVHQVDSVLLIPNQGCKSTTSQLLGACLHGTKWGEKPETRFHLHTREVSMNQEEGKENCEVTHRDFKGLVTKLYELLVLGRVLVLSVPPRSQQSVLEACDEHLNESSGLLPYMQRGDQKQIRGIMRGITAAMQDENGCPICYEPFGTSMVLGPCGHCVCSSCMHRVLLNSDNNDAIECCKCRAPIANSARSFEYVVQSHQFGYEVNAVSIAASTWVAGMFAAGGAPPTIAMFAMDSDSVLYRFYLDAAESVPLGVKTGTPFDDAICMYPEPATMPFEKLFGARNGVLMLLTAAVVRNPGTVLALVTDLIILDRDWEELQPELKEALAVRNRAGRPLHIHLLVTSRP